jgi:hypothetical protein
MRETFGARTRAPGCRFHTQTAGRVADRAAAGEQRRARGHPGPGGRAGRHAEPAHQQHGRGLALPSEEAVTVALRTQQIIAEESGVVNTVDPLAGSFFVEHETNKIEAQVYDYGLAAGGRDRRRAAGHRDGLLPLLALAALSGCAAEASDEPEVTESEDALAAKADEHWFYNGALPALEQPAITVSLKGHTARLTGLLPAGKELPALPHVKTRVENGRVRVDAVYPIATARPGKSNSRPGTYGFHWAKPYRPDGSAFTQDEGEHFVPWGGFPFIAYDGGIALHGPITATDNAAPGELSVWVLKRGTVSGGCNRMLGEHVVELTHAIGIDMRKVYGANVGFRPATPAKSPSSPTTTSTTGSSSTSTTRPTSASCARARSWAPTRSPCSARGSRPSSRTARISPRT